MNKLIGEIKLIFRNVLATVVYCFSFNTLYLTQIKEKGSKLIAVR